MRRWLWMIAFLGPACGQDTPPAPLLTAVYTIADLHPIRRTNERDPVTKIAGLCQIVPGLPLASLSCTSDPLREDRTGRRYYYSIVLLRDLHEELYLAACSSPLRDSICGELRAGQTFPAEVEGGAIRLVTAGQQLSLRILEHRAPPVDIDSPTAGTPSQVKPTAGTPSNVPYSNVRDSLGTPSNVLPSEASLTTGAASTLPLSEPSSALVSPGASRLYLEASAAPAGVYIDNQWLGYAPQVLPLVPGPHTVRVEAKGFPAWAQTIRLGPGETLRLRADLGR
jgi:hypothetical protein